MQLFLYIFHDFHDEAPLSYYNDIMRKYILLLFFFVSTLPLLSASEDVPRILLTPLEKRFDSNQYNVIAGTVYDTMLLSLRLLGEYEIITLEEDDLDFTDDAAISAYAEENSVDNVVSGSVTVDDTGRIDFALRLYKRETDSINDGIRSSAANALEVFDASDALITDLIAQFDDRHIGFGSLVFNNLGYDGEYNIFLGNTFLGESIDRAERVLIGDYKLIITHFRFNQLKILETHFISVQENNEIELTFSLPHLLPEEEEDLSTRYEELKVLLGEKRDDNPSPEILSQVFSEMEALPGMEGLDKHILRFKEREALWNLQREWWDMEESPGEYPPGNFRYGSELYNNDSLWNSPEIKEAALMNGMLYSHVLSLQASLLLRHDDLEAGMALYETLLSTASEFASENAFGFRGEYDQLKEIMDHPKRRLRWKEKSIGRLVEKRAELAFELSQEDRVTTLLVFIDQEDTRAKINGRHRTFPYLDSKYRQDELTLTLIPKKEKRIKIDFPVLGVNTIVLIPEDDPDYMRELRPKRDFQRYSAYLGIGGGSWVGARGQFRYAWGRLGISTGLEMALYFPGGEFFPVLHIPLQLDVYPIMRPTWEMSISLIGDLMTLTPYGVSQELSSSGYSIGFVLKRERLDFYFDNRVYFNNGENNSAVSVYSPQLGVRL